MAQTTLSADEYTSRQQKRENFKKAKINPYPAKSTKEIAIREAVLQFETLAARKKIIRLVGRVKLIRLHGGLCFLTIEDETGNIQVALRRNNLAVYNLYAANLDRGDFIEVAGHLFLTKKGEKTIEAKKLRLLSKSLLPLPEKWHGLSDIEIRYRQRYLDLLVNPAVRQIFTVRSLVTRAIRQFLDKNGFTEVETPILQPIPGGANARPFITRHHALGVDLYLRIAPELYLKRLLVGGYEKVYEIGRCFRNEGIDYFHNPEFTQVEFYWAYSDYHQLMKLTERLLLSVAKKISPSLEFIFEGKKFSLKPPYKKRAFYDVMLEYGGINLHAASREALKDGAKKLGIEILSGDTSARIIDEIFKKKVRPKIVAPTFIIDYPLGLSPLAKRKTLFLEKGREGILEPVERFQLIVAGVELCNAFSELNDPQEQEERFKMQETARKAGDVEAQRMDKDFVAALKYGMPPASGFGMGIDRLTMLLTNNHHIKEVILFPTLKPEK